MHVASRRALCKRFSMTSQRYRGIRERSVPPAFLSLIFHSPEYTQKLTESRSKAEGTVNFDTILNKNMSDNVSAVNRCCGKIGEKKGKIPTDFNFKLGETHVETSTINILILTRRLPFPCTCLQHIIRHPITFVALVLDKTS